MFEDYTELPISLAWEAFGPKNGAASLAQVRQSIAKLRREQVRPWEEVLVRLQGRDWPALYPITAGARSADTMRR